MRARGTVILWQEGNPVATITAHMWWFLTPIMDTPCPKEAVEEEVMWSGGVGTIWLIHAPRHSVDAGMPMEEEAGGNTHQFRKAFYNVFCGGYNCWKFYFGEDLSLTDDYVKS